MGASGFGSERALCLSMPFVKKSACPVCGYVMDHATAALGPDNLTPSPGDIGLCLNCAEILQYADDLSVKRPDLSNLLELHRETPEEWKRLCAGQELIKKRGLLYPMKQV